MTAPRRTPFSAAFLPVACRPNPLKCLRRAHSTLKTRDVGTAAERDQTAWSLPGLLSRTTAARLPKPNSMPIPLPARSCSRLMPPELNPIEYAWGT